MKNKTIYVAAALFNARETSFNLTLAENLEDRGYTTILPQRDGFEFSNLTKALEGRMESDKVGDATKDIIYLLDVGSFIPGSDIVLANLDEPIDLGVVVEMQYAKFMGKSIIGFRTDSRSPYGALDSRHGGMHDFVAYQTDALIIQPANTAELVERIVNRLDKLPNQQNLPLNPKIAEIERQAKLLFGGVPDIHCKEGLDKVVANYLDNGPILQRIRPEIIL